MLLHISSKDNKNLKLIRQLKKKSFRADTRKFIVEGKKPVLEAFDYAKDSLDSVVLSEEFLKKDPDCALLCEKHCKTVYSVPDSIFANLSDTETPQGILAVLNMPDNTYQPKAADTGIVVLDGISDPGNMGTVIRTAEALGFDGIYLTKGCCDIYSPKTVRATMGSLFRMDFRTDCTAEDIKSLQDIGFSVIATTPMGETALEGFEPPHRFAVVIGNEAHGVSDEVLALADTRIKITMDGMAESLNAAIAAGISMHWLKNCQKYFNWD